MAATSGIAWTDGTVNFVIGCSRAGPGCDHCYAAELAKHKWGIDFDDPDGERRETKSGFTEPLRWHRMHLRGQKTMHGGRDPVPVWVFACSLSDFFDNRWPPEVRARAWRVIRETMTLRWQIVTKRIGNAPKMLPDDWDEGRNYPHVGIISTMVTQKELERDMRKLLDMKTIYGAKWVGVSIEPQLEMMTLLPPGGAAFAPALDWVICGGESKQRAPAREFRMSWAVKLLKECELLGIPFFMKQLGDNCTFNAARWDAGPHGADMSRWPGSLVVQQMPRVYAPAS